MVRKLSCVILIGLLLICIFSGCQAAPDAADNKPYDSAYYNVSQFFTQYVEATMHDPVKAAEACYFEDEAEKELYLQGMQDDPILSYEIIRYEKLSDYLWVIEFCTVNDMFPSGVTGVNYVGIVDNNMLVYRNKNWLPSALTEGLEIEDYKFHGPEVLG